MIEMVESTQHKNETAFPNRQHMNLGIVELFAGAGGLAQGFMQTNLFDLIALSDIEAAAKITFETNFPDIEYLQADVTELETDMILRIADGREISGLLGGPPCQGFSSAGARNPNDERNKYVIEYLKFVRAFEPDFLLMENVPQLIFHKLFQRLLNELKCNYEVRYAVLNSAQYGVPQTRHRIFIIAYHKRFGVEPIFPAPTHGFVGDLIFNYQTRKCESPDNQEILQALLGADPVVGALPELHGKMSNTSELKPFVTVRQAISDLYPLANGKNQVNYIKESESDFQDYARQGSVKLYNHKARRHMKPMIERICKIPAGGDLEDIDKKYWPKSYYSQAYGRLHWEGLSRTITTSFCNPGSGRFTHPDDDRSLTVREAARLQGFQDSFVFEGSQSQQMELVGNAVPPPLAREIAKQIYSDLSQGF